MAGNTVDYLIRLGIDDSEIKKKLSSGELLNKSELSVIKKQLSALLDDTGKKAKIFNDNLNKGFDVDTSELEKTLEWISNFFKDMNQMPNPIADWAKTGKGVYTAFENMQNSVARLAQNVGDLQARLNGLDNSGTKGLKDNLKDLKLSFNDFKQSYQSFKPTEFMGEVTEGTVKAQKGMKAVSGEIENFGEQVKSYTGVIEVLRKELRNLSSEKVSIEGVKDFKKEFNDIADSMFEFTSKIEEIEDELKDLSPSDEKYAETAIHYAKAINAKQNALKRMKALDSEYQNKNKNKKSLYAGDNKDYKIKTLETEGAKETIKEYIDIISAFSQEQITTNVGVDFIMPTAPDVIKKINDVVDDINSRQESIKSIKLNVDDSLNINGGSLIKKNNNSSDEDGKRLSEIREKIKLEIDSIQKEYDQGIEELNAANKILNEWNSDPSNTEGMNGYWESKVKELEVYTKNIEKTLGKYEYLYTHADEYDISDLENNWNKSETFFKSLDATQERVLNKTDKWRKEMVKKLKFKSGDFEFNFRDAIFEELQQVFNNNPLEVVINSEKLKTDIENVLKSTDGNLGFAPSTTTANINPEGMVSAFYTAIMSALTGKKVPMIDLFQSSEESKNEELTSGSSNDSGKSDNNKPKYAKELGSDTIGIKEVVDELSRFANMMERTNASEGGKKVESWLKDFKGIDLDVIRRGVTKDGVVSEEVYTMLTKALMTENENGWLNGTSLVDSLKSKMKEYGLKPKKGGRGAADALKALTDWIENLLKRSGYDSEEAQEEANKRYKMSIFKQASAYAQGFTLLSGVRSKLKYSKDKNGKEYASGIMKDDYNETDIKNMPTDKDISDMSSYILSLDNIGNKDDLKKIFDNLLDARKALGDSIDPEDIKVFKELVRDFYENTRELWDALTAQSKFEGKVYFKTGGSKEVKNPWDIIKIVQNNNDNKPFKNQEEFIKAFGDSGFGIYDVEDYVDIGGKGQSHQTKKTYKENIRTKDIKYPEFKISETSTNELQLEAWKDQAAELPQIEQDIKDAENRIKDLEKTKESIENDIKEIEGAIPKIDTEKFNKASKSKNGVFQNLENAKEVFNTIKKNAKSPYTQKDIDSTGVNLKKARDNLETQKGELKKLEMSSAASDEIERQRKRVEEAGKIVSELSSKFEAMTSAYKSDWIVSSVPVDDEVDSIMSSLRDEIENYSKLTDEFKQAPSSIKKLSKIDINNLSENQVRQAIDQIRGEIDPKIFKELMWPGLKGEKNPDTKGTLQAMLKKYEDESKSTKSKIETSKGSINSLLKKLESRGNMYNVDASKEAKPVAEALQEAKNSLFEEANKFVQIIENSETSDRDRELTLGKLQETIRYIGELSAKFDAISKYVPSMKFFGYGEKTKFNNLQKTYGKNGILGEERAQKTILEEKQSDLTRIEGQISEEQKKLNEGDKNGKGEERIGLRALKDAAQDSQRRFEIESKATEFANKYNELLERREKLLEEILELKKKGKDVDEEENQLKQLDDEITTFIGEYPDTNRQKNALVNAKQTQIAFIQAKQQRNANRNKIRKIEEDKQWGMSSNYAADSLRKTKNFLSNEYRSVMLEQLREIMGLNSDKFNKPEENMTPEVSDEYNRLKEILDNQLKNAVDQFWKSINSEGGILNFDYKIPTLKRGSDGKKVIDWQTDNKKAESFIKGINEDVEGGSKYSEYSSFDESGRMSIRIKDKILQDLDKSREAAEKILQEDADLIYEIESTLSKWMTYGGITYEDLNNDKLMSEWESLQQKIEGNEAGIERIKNVEKQTNLPKAITEIKEDKTKTEEEKTKEIDKWKEKQIAVLNKENEEYKTKQLHIEQQIEEEKNKSNSAEEEIIKSTEELTKAKNRLVKLDESIANAEERAAQAVETYGKESDEAKRAQYILNDLQGQREGLNNSIAYFENKINRLNGNEDQEDGIGSSVGTSEDYSGGLIGMIERALGGGASIDIEGSDIATESTLRAIFELLSGGGAKSKALDEIKKGIASNRNKTRRYNQSEDEDKNEEYKSRSKEPNKTDRQLARLNEEGQKKFKEIIGASKEYEKELSSSNAISEMGKMYKEILDLEKNKKQGTVEYIQAQHKLSKAYLEYRGKLKDKDVKNEVVTYGKGKSKKSLKISDVQDKILKKYNDVGDALVKAGYGKDNSVSGGGLHSVTKDKSSSTLVEDLESAKTFDDLIALKKKTSDMQNKINSMPEDEAEKLPELTQLIEFEDKIYAMFGTIKNASAFEHDIKKSTAADDIGRLMDVAKKLNISIPDKILNVFGDKVSGIEGYSGPISDEEKSNRALAILKPIFEPSIAEAVKESTDKNPPKVEVKPEVAQESNRKPRFKDSVKILRGAVSSLPTTEEGRAKRYKDKVYENPEVQKAIEYINLNPNLQDENIKKLLANLKTLEASYNKVENAAKKAADQEERVANGGMTVKDALAIMKDALPEKEFSDYKRKSDAVGAYSRRVRKNEDPKIQEALKILTDSKNLKHLPEGGNEIASKLNRFETEWKKSDTAQNKPKADDAVVKEAENVSNEIKDYQKILKLAHEKLDSVKLSGKGITNEYKSGVYDKLPDEVKGLADKIRGNLEEATEEELDLCVKVENLKNAHDRFNAPKDKPAKTNKPKVVSNPPIKELENSVESSNDGMSKLKKVLFENGDIVEGTAKEIEDFGKKVIGEIVDGDEPNTEKVNFYDEFQEKYGKMMGGTYEEIRQWIESKNNNSQSDEDYEPDDEPEDNNSVKSEYDIIASGDGGLLDMVGRLAQEGTLDDVSSTVDTIDTTIGKILETILEFSKNQASLSLGKGNSAQELISRLEGMLLSSDQEKRERMAFLDTETGVLTRDLSGNNGEFSETLINALKDSYKRYNLKAQIHTHNNGTSEEDSYFSDQDLTQFSADLKNKNTGKGTFSPVQILLANGGMSVLDMSDATSIEEMLDGLKSVTRDFESVSEYVSKFGATFKMAKFKDLWDNPQNIVDILGIKGIESKYTEEQTRETARQTVADELKKEAARMVQESSGRSTKTTVQNTGIERETVTEKTDAKGNKTWTSDISNRRQKEIEAFKQKILEQDLGFGENTVASKALDNYIEKYGILIDLVNEFNEASEDQRGTIQEKINKVLPEFNKSEKKLTELIDRRDKFVGDDEILEEYTFDGNQLKNTRRNLEAIARQRYGKNLNPGDNVAFNGYTRGKGTGQLSVDVLKDGVIKQYVLEVDKATGQVKEYVETENALANAFLNVEKAMKQSKTVMANVAIGDGPNKQAKWMEGASSPTLDAYKNAVDEMQKYSIQLWDSRKAPNEKQLDYLMQLSEKVIRLGKDVQDTSGKFKNFWDQNPDKVSTLNFRGNETVQSAMERYAQDNAKTNASKYDFVSFDNNTLKYKLTDVQGNVSQISLVWDELYKKVAMVSDKSTSSIDLLVSKIKKYKETIDDAKSYGYLLESDDAEFNKAIQHISEIEEKVKKDEASFEDLEAAWKRAVKEGAAATKLANQNEKARVGTNEIRSVIRQKDKIVGISGIDLESDEQSDFIQEYIAAYNALIAKHQEYVDNNQISDPKIQESLRQQAQGVNKLGREILTVTKDAEDLQRYVDSSGTYTDKSGVVRDLGRATPMARSEIKNMKDTMNEYAKTVLGVELESSKFDNTTQTMTGTLRQNNKVVSDMVIKYNDATEQMYLFQKQERESLSGFPAFMRDVKAKAKGIVQYLASITSIYRVWGTLKQGVNYVKEIDAALTELKKVTDETEESYDKFLKTAGETASKVGSTVKEIVSSTADWARLNI